MGVDWRTGPVHFDGVSVMWGHEGTYSRGAEYILDDGLFPNPFV